MELNGKSITFLGDSITEGHGASEQSKRFTDLMPKITPISGIKNYGIGGTRIARQQNITPETEWWDTNSYCERFDKMEASDIIVVFGGTNDYGHGDAPFGDFKTDNTPDTFCGALHYLMKGLMERFPESEIVFMTPIHREGENNPNGSNNRPLSDYVDMIKKAANYYSLPVLDMYANFGVNPNIPAHKELYCPDGLHPNDRGYKKIAERLKSFLEAL